MRLERLTHRAAAILIAAALAASWVVPALLSAATPRHTIPVEAGEVREIDTHTGRTVQFRAPFGWEERRLYDGLNAEFVQDAQGRSILVSVAVGAIDFETSAPRRLDWLDSEGVTAALDGGTVSTANGFQGRSCIALRPESHAIGPCAVVHVDDVIVTVVATGKEDEQPPEFRAILDSLVLVRHHGEEGR